MGIWNSSGVLEVCQVLNLVIPTTDGILVIAEDKHEITIDFDLTADFSFNNSLASGTIENATGATNVSSSVQAYKCVGGESNSFAKDLRALAPSEELSICIKSVDGDIELDELVEMTITQTPSTKIEVVVNRRIVLEAITSTSGLLDLTPPEGVSNGLILTTFIPLNIFNFADNENITIVGSVNMRLAGTTRMLRALFGEEPVATGDGPKEASYEVNVKLQGIDGLGPKDKVFVGSSDGHAITGKGLAILGLIVASICYSMV